MFRLKFIFVPHRSLLCNNKVFPVLENKNDSILIVFLLLENLSENNLVSKNIDLLKKI